MATPTLGQILASSARRGTQREYETVTILRPSANKADILDLVRRVQEILSRQGGRLVKVDSWGMRMLAYPVARCKKGIYLYFRYVGGSEMVAELERNLRNLDLVIRFYSVRIDDNIDPEARPSEVTDAILDAVSEPGPDPEELARKAEEERARAGAERADLEDEDEMSDGSDDGED
jgi:small subunit ribosomal protein S6